MGAHLSATPMPPVLGRGMTMSDQLGRHARVRPNAEAFVLGDVRLTYAVLDERVGRLAGALRERGTAPGDRVALFGLNSLEMIETYLAVARLGAVCVPINFRLVAAEVAYALRDSGATAAVVHGALVEPLGKALDLTHHKVSVLVHHGAMAGADDYEHALASAPVDPGTDVVDENAAAIIMYTSGTTGSPKGVVLTHRSLMMHPFSESLHRGVAAGDRVAAAATPLFHIAGLSAALTTLLLGGCTILLPSGHFDAGAMVDLLERERVTSVFLVPTQWQAVCDLPGVRVRDFSALREIGWGAAPATTTLLQLMMDTFPQAEVSTAFGQTECGGILTLLRGRDSVRKIGSIGTPVLNVEARVVDQDMQDVRRGQVGELVYRSPMMMNEYWGNPAATAQVFVGGWLHSGDLVRQDEEGYYFVVDRIKDMIISGGENIYCAEVENVLAAHPQVAEVALIGVPDPTWGEIPLAVVVPHGIEAAPTAAELVAWCEDRLARYKRPRSVAIVDALPRNPSGKVLKSRIRATHAADGLRVQTA